jgi:hypothetical protein
VVGKNEVGIRVRMYRVGFGDFFLLTFLDDAQQPHHVIIDCGVFKGTSQTGDIGSIEAAVADMKQTTGGELALIVMTHRHADHIAGFARCADVFGALTVGGVWMPIWENEYDPTAAEFQAQLTRTALGLRRHFAAFGAGESEEQATPGSTWRTPRAARPRRQARTPMRSTAEARLRGREAETLTRRRPGRAAEGARRRRPFRADPGTAAHRRPRSHEADGPAKDRGAVP